MLTSLRAILRGAARSLGVERAAYAAMIEEMWVEIVGPQAAANSQPRIVRGGVLLVDVEPGPWAQELTAQRARFVAEINRRIGVSAIEEIRVRQQVGVAKRQKPEDARTPADETPLEPGEVAAIDRAVEEIRDPEVRETARRAMVSHLKWRKKHAP